MHDSKKGGNLSLRELSCLRICVLRQSMRSNMYRWNCLRASIQSGIDALGICEAYNEVLEKDLELYASVCWVRLDASGIH